MAAVCLTIRKSSMTEDEWLLGTLFALSFLGPLTDAASV